MPTLASYNTSYVNDCHSSQFNSFMSESSSILAKAIKIYNAKHTESPITLNYKDYDKLTPEYKSNVEADETLKAEYARLTADSDIGAKLENLRIRMSVRNTNYLNTLLKNNVDFVALIEQIVHAGTDNHANYDEFLNTPLDLKAYDKNGESENEKWGLLCRLKSMTDVEDVDEPSTDSDPQNYTYACVYDTIVNCQGQMQKQPVDRSSVAEGISIIYRKEIFGNNPVMATWKKKSSASVQKLQTLNPEAFEKIVDRDVHYYSDDSGMSLCYPKGIPANQDEENTTTPLEFVTQRGKADGGRPIIMTAGVNTDTNSLIILVAVHGPNIPNLYKNGDDLDNRQNQLKNRFDEEIDRLFDKVRISISKFINDGIKAIDPNSKVKNQNIKNVEVYFGGDLNDARGLILKRLLHKPNKSVTSSDATAVKNEKTESINQEVVESNGGPNPADESNSTEQNKPASDDFGLKLSFGFGSTENARFEKIVTFSSYSDLEKDVNAPTDAKTDTQGRYKSLYSCCANGDSLTGEKRYDAANKDLNKQGNGVFDMVHLYEFSKFSDNMTNLEFIDPKNFGYNGDYALYGTTDQTFNETMRIMLDSTDTLKVNSVAYSSDHLPVISSLTNPPFQSKGGRRRRYSRRAPIRRTRKGVPKKLRASRRKRRARTYKKI